MAQIKASDLVAIFKQMASEKWKYVAGGRKQGEVDCSGAFYYAYKQLGGYMYHGSNTMYRKYTVEKGKVGEINLVPGMAVFKCRDWSSSQSSNGWYGDDPGDVYHVGMYIGNDEVVEAKGTKYGVVISKLSTWHYAAKLVDTEYNLAEGSSVQPMQSMIGSVNISSGYLNLRTGPSRSYPYAAKAYNGDCLTVVGETGDWYQIDYDGKTLYASKQYVLLSVRAQDVLYEFRIVVPASEKSHLANLLSGYEYTVAESGAAA